MLNAIYISLLGGAALRVVSHMATSEIQKRQDCKSTQLCDRLMQGAVSDVLLSHGDICTMEGLAKSLRVCYLFTTFPACQRCVLFHHGHEHDVAYWSVNMLVRAGTGSAS